MKTLNEFYEFAKKKAKLVFNSYGHHTPMFLFYTDNGVQVIGTPWSNPEEKMLAIAAMKQAGKALDAHFVVMITEAWIAEAAMTSGDLSTLASASQHPDRKEALWIVGQTKERDATAMQGYYEVIRKSNGTATVGNFVPYSGMSVFDNILGTKVLH